MEPEALGRNNDMFILRDNVVRNFGLYWLSNFDAVWEADAPRYVKTRIVAQKLFCSNFEVFTLFYNSSFLEGSLFLLEDVESVILCNFYRI